MLRQQVAMNYAFDNLVGVTPEIQKVKRIIQHSANNRTTVILSGEEGTGKNLIARIIHYHSPDRNNPLIIIDCSADTSENALSELVENKSAKGTLLIDKLHLADKATRLNLQKQIAQGLAGDGAGFRLIMTINEPLFNMYAKGIIDRKLIEGLSAIEISLPALRDRTEDIEILVSYFLRMISFENNAPTPSITASALAMLKSHSWPENVRELVNCLRRAAAVCSNNCIDVSELRIVTAGSAQFRVSSDVDKSSKSASLEENQRHLITDALDHNDWNFSQTAIQLGIGRTTLWRKVRKFNLKRSAEIVSEFEPAIKEN
jgi:DNA-binding NtrC family response regulator